MTAQNLTAGQSVYGVRDALKTLREVSPKLERDARKAMREAVAPMAAAASAGFGSEPPLPGMRRGRSAWSAKDRKVTTKTGGRTNRAKTEWPLVSIRAAGAGASIFDMAGKSSPGVTSLVSVLTARFGRPSRNMWPIVEGYKGTIDRALTEAVKDTMAQASAELAYKPGGMG